MTSEVAQVVPSRHRRRWFLTLANEAPPRTRRVRWLSWWGDVAGSGESWWYTTARWLWRCAMATRLITVNDILAGHVSLDGACLDRIYLNGYLPTVQVPGQDVVHRDQPLCHGAPPQPPGRRVPPSLPTPGDVTPPAQPPNSTVRGGAALALARWVMAWSRVNTGHGLRLPAPPRG